MLTAVRFELKVSQMPVIHNVLHYTIIVNTYFVNVYYYKIKLQRISPPRHIEIGTVSLPANARYIGLNFPHVCTAATWFFQLDFHFLHHWTICKYKQVSKLIRQRAASPSCHISTTSRNAVMRRCVVMDRHYVPSKVFHGEIFTRSNA